jgi:hypothetical protein
MTKLKPLMTHVTDNQKAQIEQAAEAQHIGVSEYLRRALVNCGVIDAADIEIRHGGKRSRKKVDPQK